MWSNGWAWRLNGLTGWGREAKARQQMEDFKHGRELVTEINGHQEKLHEARRQLEDLKEQKAAHSREQRRRFFGLGKKEITKDENAKKGHPTKEN